MASTLAIFLAGADTLGLALGALLFLRGWRRTRDLLFGAFAAAFVLLAINQALTVFIHLPEPEKSWIYLFRLVGFVLIILAILGKNMQARAPGHR
jgi:zinc transporter ZupT